MKAISRCYEFKLGDNITKLFLNIPADITLRYTDSDITSDIRESMLGIVYWDENKQIWSTEGISDVVVNTTLNEISFKTNHLSAFAIMEINSTMEIIIESPKDNGYSSANPLISIRATDGFNGIKEIKLLVDDNDYTSLINSVASSDGIDNNMDGRIDEKGGNENSSTDDEQAFNILSFTSARLIGRLSINLKEGKHTLTAIVTNQQGQSFSKSIVFNVGTKLNFVEKPFNYPNPFKPTKGEITNIVPNITKDAEVTINIYDAAGDKVTTLGPKMVYGSIGQMDILQWDGTESRSKKYLADGIYFAEIIAKDNSYTIRKFIKIAITSK